LNATNAACALPSPASISIVVRTLAVDFAVILLGAPFKIGCS